MPHPVSIKLKNAPTLIVKTDDSAAPVKLSVTDLNTNGKWSRSDYSTVNQTGTAITRTIDPTYRSSETWQHSSGAKPKLCLSAAVNAQRKEFMKNLSLGQFGVDNLADVTNFGDGELEIIRYSRGSFFGKHMDRDRSTDKLLHYGTLLYIGYCPYAMGGDLLQCNPISSLAHSHNSATEDWYLVYMPLGCLHQVTDLHRGIRYTFKYTLYLPRSAQIYTQVKPIYDQMVEKYRDYSQAVIDTENETLRNNELIRERSRMGGAD